MKRLSSVFRMVLAALAVTTVCLGIPSSVASSQDASASNTKAAPTPAAIAVPALRSDVAEVVKRYQSGINKEVIINYINNTSDAVSLEHRWNSLSAYFGNAAGDYRSYAPARRPVTTSAGHAAVLHAAATVGSNGGAKWCHGNSAEFAGCDSGQRQLLDVTTSFGLSGL